MDRPDQITNDPPSTCEAKKRVAALGLTGPRTCGRCGQLRKGRILYGYTEYFLCFNCLVKDEAKALSETDEFIRKDRIWKMRIAREIWKNKNAVKSKYEDAVIEFPEMTLKEKECLANKILKSMNMPVISSETVI